jgi:hypothetical protein
MHVPDESKIFFVSRRHANRGPPLFYKLQYLHLRPRGMYRRPLGKSTNQLIEEFLGADLKVKRITAVLNTNIQQLYYS